MLCPCARHFILCYCGNVFNAFMKKMSIKNSIDPDEMLHNAASHQGVRYLPC